jgi:hypothetical protein
VRLISSTAPATGDAVDIWLQGAPGRVHHLTFEAVEADAVPGVRPATSPLSRVGATSGGPVWEIERSDNSGLALVLVPVARPTTGATSGGPVS